MREFWQFTDSPHKGYPFGLILKKPFQLWVKPAVFSQKPFDIAHILLRWGAQAGYLAYTDINRILYGLAFRGFLAIEAYWEEPVLSVRAQAGIEVLPQGGVDKKSDVLKLWAPVYNLGEEKPLVTGFLRVVVDPRIDFQNLIDAFVVEALKEDIDIIGVFMDSGSKRGYPLTTEEEAKIQKIIGMAER